MIVIRCIFIVLMFFVCISCATMVDTTNNHKSNIPEWVYSPSKDGVIGGVGICGTHVKGKTAQRQLAISRAIDEISRQMGVTVSNVLETSSNASTNTYSSSSLNSYSIQTVTGTAINAEIVDTWFNSSTGELYVYMRIK